MKNSIIEQYRFELELLKNKSKANIDLRNLIDQCIESISTCHTVETLITTLERCIAKLPSSGQQSIAFFEPLTLRPTLDDWLGNLRTFSDNIKPAKAHLLSLEITEATFPLKQLLLELLDHPQFLFHVCARGVLEAANPVKLSPALMSYLTNLKQAPLEYSIRSGSFSDQQALNANHHACIMLLQKVASAYNEQCQHFNDANQLLQNLLRVYPDLLNPSPAAEFRTAPPESSSGGCSIL